jgi:hypothetical protein
MQDAIVICEDKKEVAKVDAVYNFSNLPQKYHDIVLNLIMQKSQDRIVLR